MAHVTFSDSDRMWSAWLLFPLVELVSSRVRTSGQLLATPRVEKCENRPKYYMEKRAGHFYFSSGKSHFGEYKVRTKSNC